MCFLSKLLSKSDEVSTTRLMAVLSLIVGSGIGIYGVIKGKDLSGIAQICAVFVSSAFAAKIGQKYIEGKNEKNNV